MKVSSKFAEAMYVLVRGGIVRRKGWGEGRYLEVRKMELGGYVDDPASAESYGVEIRVPLLFDETGKTSPVPWSPSLADFNATDWEIIENAKMNEENGTFGSVLKKLLNGEVKSIYHPDWKQGVRIVSNDGDLRLVLVSGKEVDYCPTVPDIVRLNWQIEASLVEK